jgi:hypothetical protein
MIPNGNFLYKVFAYSELQYIFAVRKGGAIAQSVEQRTENPCVPGSIPGGTTSFKTQAPQDQYLAGLFVLIGFGIVDGFYSIQVIKYMPDYL